MVDRVPRPELPCDFHGDLMPPESGIHRATPHEGREKGSTCSQCGARNGYQCFDTRHTPDRWLERHNRRTQLTTTDEFQEPPAYQPEDATGDIDLSSRLLNDLRALNDPTSGYQGENDMNLMPGDTTGNIDRRSRLLSDRSSRALNDPIDYPQQTAHRTERSISSDTSVTVRMGHTQYSIKMNIATIRALLLMTIMAFAIWIAVQSIWLWQRDLFWT